MAAQRLEAHAPFEIRERIGHRKRCRGKHHRFLVRERPRLKLPAGGGGSGLYERPPGAPFRSDPVEALRLRLQERLHHEIDSSLQLRDEQVELALGVGVAVQWELRAGAIEALAQGVRPLSQDAGKLRKRDSLRPGA